MRHRVRQTSEQVEEVMFCYLESGVAKAQLHLAEKTGEGGADTAILDIATRQRADGLIRTRQRVHAGLPGGPPDLRPEEARKAKATAELVVRRVLDWLEKYLPQKAPRG
jgi:hypothetical protein